MMTGFCIVLGIVLFVLYVSMMTTMVILERDKPKNIIIWSVVFLISQIVGYIAYLIIRHVIYKKRSSFDVKLKEDEIYDKLSSNNLHKNHTETYNDVFEFNNLAFNAGTCVNNAYELICDHNTLKLSLIDDIKKAKNYIIFELTKVNTKDFQGIKNALIEKSKTNVIVKFVHDGAINHKLKTELVKAGVKVYRFSKFNAVGNVYSNLRNVISIDGEVAYIGNLNISNNQLQSNSPVANTV